MGVQGKFERAESDEAERVAIAERAMAMADSLTKPEKGYASEILIAERRVEVWMEEAQTLEMFGGRLAMQ